MYFVFGKIIVQADCVSCRGARLILKVHLVISVKTKKEKRIAKPEKS